MAYCGPRGIPLSAFLSWPDADQDAALAWQAHEQSRCSECGTHAEDWLAEQAPVHWAPQVCPGCQAKGRVVAELRDDKDRTRGLGVSAHGGPVSACPTCTKLRNA